MLRNSRLLKSLLGANVMKEWFATLALRSFRISVLILKPSIFLKTFFISKFRWIKRVSKKKRESIKFAAWLPSRQEEFGEVVWSHSMLASFVAESPYLLPRDGTLASWTCNICYSFILIQEGIEREKNFNFILCVFSPDHFCQKILPPAPFFFP